MHRGIINKLLEMMSLLDFFVNFTFCFTYSTGYLTLLEVDRLQLSIVKRVDQYLSRCPNIVIENFSHILIRLIISYDINSCLLVRLMHNFEY